MVINVDTVIAVFNGAIDCLSSLLDTSVGGWIGCIIILLGVFRFIKALANI